MSSDTTRTDTTLRYHLLGVLCWLYPVGYPRICQMHNTWKAMCSVLSVNSASRSS